MPKSWSCREVLSELKKSVPDFQVHPDRGKGGHIVVTGKDASGRDQMYTLPAMRKSAQVKTPYLRNLVRRFGLREDFFRR